MHSHEDTLGRLRDDAQVGQPSDNIIPGHDPLVLQRYAGGLTRTARNRRRWTLTALCLHAATHRRNQGRTQQWPISDAGPALGLAAAAGVARRSRARSTAGGEDRHAGGASGRGPPHPCGEEARSQHAIRHTSGRAIIRCASWSLDSSAGSCASELHR